jgi:hypothetical protein
MIERNHMSDTYRTDQVGVRQYKDVSGNPCSLSWLVRNEPEWAANQIRNRDKLERELNAANERIKRMEEAGDSMANHIDGGLCRYGKTTAWEYAKKPLNDSSDKS